MLVTLSASQSRHRADRERFGTTCPSSALAAHGAWRFLAGAWTRLSTGTRKSELELIVLGPLPLNQTISAWPGNCAWKGGGDHLPHGPRAHATRPGTRPHGAASSMSRRRAEVNRR